MDTTYPELVGKKVELTYRSNGDVFTETGTVKVANSTGVMFQKGQKSTLILNHEIEDHSIVASTPKASTGVGVKAKRLDPVTDGTVKRHLALHHALLLSEVNNMSVFDALKAHEGQHEEFGADFPHFHAEKNDSGEERQ